MGKFVYLTIVGFLKLASAILFLSSHMHGFRESQRKTWPILMQPTPASYWPDGRMQLHVAFVVSPTSSHGNGSKACKAHIDLLHPSLHARVSLSTLLCLPHPLVIYAILMYCGLF